MKKNEVYYVSDLLGRGREAAKTAAYLAGVLGCHARDVRGAIQRERLEGVPICANSGKDSGGYFLPATREELSAYRAQLARRIIEILKTLCALEGATVEDA